MIGYDTSARIILDEDKLVLIAMEKEPEVR
jgi:hypothetical protein